ncbi:oxidoreductase [Salmonella enterica subsp. enterica]|uniref:Oxidoreductase n=1 Tax=Salmonella enterica I TaxID=59201 RepID=A0A3S4G5H2_SALET|nr:oxidoreductase [Salmonella enterica subsp. enterica]
MDYGDFSVTLQHSKVSDSVLASEIQGERGSLVIEKLSECQKVCFAPRGALMQDLTQPQHINTMLYEAGAFAQLIENHAGGTSGVVAKSRHGKMADRNTPSNRGHLPGGRSDPSPYCVKLCKLYVTGH